MAINAKDLLEKKKLIEDRQNQKVMIETPLGDFTFKVPTIDILTDAKTYESAHKDKDNQYCVYKCCLEPDLKDQDLQREFNKGKDPIDIVDTIFLPGEISTIANILVEKAGYESKTIKAVEGIKN